MCYTERDRLCEGCMCDCLTIQMREGWWGEGVTVVFQALCLQKQPCLHLGTTGDMTAIRSLCSWLIVHNISMEWLLQGPVCPVTMLKTGSLSSYIQGLRVRNSPLFIWVLLHLREIYVFYKYTWYFFDIGRSVLMCMHKCTTHAKITV